MENNIPIPETSQPVRGVRWKQTTAGVLFVLTYVLFIIANFAPQLLRVTIWSSEHGDMTYISANIITCPLFMLCAFLLLRPLSANRVVRLVTLVLAIAYGFMLVVRVLAFLVFSPESSASLFMCDVMSNWTVFFIMLFAEIFSFGCILKNCAQFLASSRVWVQLILCFMMIGVTDYAYNLMMDSIPVSVDFMQVYFKDGLFYGIFNALKSILLAIAYYKFAKSDLFCGVFDDSPAPAGAYSIVNKYWAAVLVVIVLFSVAMYLVLSNADKLLYS